MSFAVPDARAAELTRPEGGLRLLRPELDFASVEEALLNRPALVRDPRRDRFYTGSHFFKRAENR
jgi:hypothetical protein